MSKTAQDRKKAQRERDRSQGVKRVEVRLSAELAAKLEQACKIRGGTGREPYDASEYLVTLLEKDLELLDLHLEQLGGAPCGKCGSTLPGGCGGVHRWDIGCLHTREENQLLLTEPFRVEA